ncbi:hypothetical protein AB1Y20_008410 [Prymnesium parvum]|uniref:ceramide glucosyltransferase n=1 Tax=Prymnesium parvum TaxID=97485 RepID=A0AB34IQZ7_PRYPA
MAPLLLEWGVPLTAVQVLGALFMSALTIALASMERVRAKFAQGIKTLEQENPLAFIAPDVSKFRHSYQLTLPKCGVVMPVKGVHGQSYANWRAQITSLYGGQLEFFFCVESEDDPAFPHIQRLQRENPEFRIHLCVAGRSWHCSQKIHNQLHGFELAMHSCHYVIVIDDDIQLHPGTIRAWVEEMETDATALLASGYAFEYVAKDVTSWTPYLWMLWRLCASTGFNHTVDRPTNCWGGALMYRASELQANVYGIIDAWRDGGYSEDFISLSLARLHRRTIAVPKAALFPSEVGDTPFFRFWNFVCRQVYVLTQTYATGAQRFIAIGGAFVNGFMHASIFLGAVATATFALYIAYGLGRIALVRDASLRDVCDERCLAPACGAAFYCFGLVVFALAAKQCLTTFARLCNVLSPELPPIDVSHVKLSHLMIAYMIYAPIVPAATLTTLTSSSILWSGVRFTARAGRVISMHRMNEQGEWFTVPREKSLETAFRAITKRQVEHDPLLRSLAQ